MSLFSSLGQSIEHLGQFLSGEFGKLIQELEPIAKTDVTNALASLIPLAIPIVTELASGQLSSTDKRNAALASLGSAAESAGISVGTSVLNSAIELGLQIAATQSPVVAASLNKPASAGTATPTGTTAAPASAPGVVPAAS
jgi:hypothetical protein